MKPQIILLLLLARLCAAQSLLPVGMEYGYLYPANTVFGNPCWSIACDILAVGKSYVITNSGLDYINILGITGSLGTGGSDDQMELGPQLTGIASGGSFEYTAMSTGLIFIDLQPNHGQAVNATVFEIPEPSVFSLTGIGLFLWIRKLSHSRRQRPWPTPKNL